MSLPPLTSIAVTAVENVGQSIDPLATRIEQLKVVEAVTAAMRSQLELQHRAEIAQASAPHRIQPGTRDYMVHLRHCYPKDGVDGFPAFCKYGEDDICPAALFEDPWAEYLRLEAEEDSQNNS